MSKRKKNRNFNEPRPENYNFNDPEQLQKLQQTATPNVGYNPNQNPTVPTHVQQNSAPAQMPNPLLQKTKLPGEIFKLPSGGIFYTNGELSDDVIDGEVMIHPMVTMDEIIMKTPDRLLNGTAITEVIRRCVPQILKPLDILGKDMDYILIALRKITYGKFYEVIFQHNCENAKEHTYMIDIDAWLQSNKRIDKTVIMNECVLTFENNQVCSLIPPRYKQILKVYKSFDKDNSEAKPEEITREFIDSVSSLIDNVDGITDSNNILEWLNNIPAGYLRQISDKIETITNWGVENVVMDTCKDCGEKIEMAISLNPVSFFT